MVRGWRGLSRVVGTTVVAASAALVVAVTPSAAAAALPTGGPALSGGVNGQVYATLVVGDILYVGGTFSSAQAQGGSATDRSDLAAFDLDTGALLTQWQADANGIVRALASSGNHLYVGGDFTRIGGVSQARLARLNLTTGNVDPGFEPKVNGSVRALATGGGAVFAGGGFTMSGGAAQRDLAKFDADTGAKISAYTAQTDGAVDSLALSPDGSRLAVGGDFDTLSGVNRLGMGLVDPTTGNVVGPAFAASVDPMLSLSWSDDGSALFGGSGNSNNVAARWNPTTGARGWHLMVGGDVQAVAAYDGDVYVGFHDNYQGDTHTKLLAVDATSGSISAAFRPTFNQFWGVRSISAGPWGLVIGGQFTKVSDVWAHDVATWPTATTSTVTVGTPAHTRYGAAARVMVSVPGASGSVTFSGAGPDQVASLSGGTATFTLPTTLAVGRHTVTASYAGDRRHLAASGSGVVRVTKAATRVRATILRQPTRHRAGQLGVKVVSRKGGGHAPTGAITVRLSRGGTRQVVRATLQQTGTATVTLPRLAAGSWRLVVHYGGDADHKVATHRSRLTVASE